MTDGKEQVDISARPFTTFNFEVEFTLNDGAPLSAGFAECGGLEIAMQPKTIREGGNNSRPIHLVGPVSYSMLSLKRGMTPNHGLWDWFDSVLFSNGGHIRATIEIIMVASQRSSPAPEKKDSSNESEVKKNIGFKLTGCLPIKMKAPALNAKDGLLAIEEMEIAYETLSYKRY